MSSLDKLAQTRLVLTFLTDLEAKNGKPYWLRRNSRPLLKRSRERRLRSGGRREIRRRFGS
jgi:hypothetical protein